MDKAQNLVEGSQNKRSNNHSLQRKKLSSAMGKAISVRPNKLVLICLISFNSEFITFQFHVHFTANSRQNQNVCISYWQFILVLSARHNFRNFFIL
jgi:hypothetical protein